MSELHLADTIMECYRLLDAMKADGVSPEVRAKTLEQTVRQVWPFTREWKYLCQSCGDVGLEMHTCPGDATCGKSNPHLPHDYGTPCWCDVGRKFRQKERTPDDLVASAAKVKKPSRFGR